MTEMFGEAWSPMSVPDLAPDDDEHLPDGAISKHYRIGLCLHSVWVWSTGKF